MHPGKLKKKRKKESPLNGKGQAKGSEEHKGLGLIIGKVCTLKTNKQMNKKTQYESCKLNFFFFFAS